MPPVPQVIVFDVNETLSDMSTMPARLVEVGAPGQLASAWFAGVLRDGFALTTAGEPRRFADLAVSGLRDLLRDQPLTCSLDDAVTHVIDGLMSLEVHPDVPAGVQALAEADLRLVTLTNGSTEVAHRLLTGAGLRSSFERLLSVEQAGAWKPARRAYEYAADECEVDIAAMLLVAVHPWDIDGAARAGMGTAWIDRFGADYPAEVFTSPTLEAGGIDQLASSVVEQRR